MGGRHAFASFGWHFLVSDAWDPSSDTFGLDRSFMTIVNLLASRLAAALITPVAP